MTVNLIVVDGPNVMNDAARILGKDGAFAASSAEVRQRYYEKWFDIDRLVRTTLLGQIDVNPVADLGIVIFHSRCEIGQKGEFTVSGNDKVSTFWGRQGNNTGTSTMLVDLPRPGAQEKGVDTSMIVYLFETSENWGSAVLFTKDTDFVPAVTSLRRRGKRVFCSSDSTEPTPLSQVCQHFFRWSLAFLRADRALFEFLQPGGTLDEFLAREEILGRNPTVTCSEGWDQLVIDSTPHGNFLGSEWNALNSMLALSGLLYATGGGKIVVQAKDTSKPDSPAASPNGHFIFWGIHRHRDLFAAAAWYGRFRG
jgi:uncharacterized LabA/DUF88 family protein